MAELSIGKKIPSFVGTTTAGEKKKLEALMGKKGLVLYFYPKDNTPGCTTEACDFRDNFSAIQKLGYNVVGVSKDNAKSHQKFIDKQELNFELLSDDDTSQICEKFGVWGEKQMMGRKYMGIIRSSFIIGLDSKLIKIYSPVKVAGHVAEILKDLKELK